MNSCELVTFISSLACAISRSCDPDDIAMLAAILTQLGDTLATITVHEEICSKNTKDE